MGDVSSEEECDRPTGRRFLIGNHINGGVQGFTDSAIRTGASNPRTKGRIYDDPPELTTGTQGITINVLIPSAWIEESEDNFKAMLSIADGSTYYAFGGATRTASDQADFLSPAHRDAGVMHIALPFSCTT